MKDSTINKKIIILVLISFCFSVFTFARIDYNPTSPVLYDSSGRIVSLTKIWVGRVAVTSGTGQSVDISSAGFNNIISTNIQPENNTSTATAMPNMSEKSCTTTTLTFNTLVPNSGVLGILVGAVAPTTFTGMYANIIVLGN